MKHMNTFVRTRELPMKHMNTFVRTIALAVLLGLALPWAAHARVKVGVSDWPGWVAWYVAQEKGFFQTHGADVELVWFASYTDSIAALTAGKLDANSQALSDTLAPLAAGTSLKVVLVNDNSAGNDAILARPGIKGVADLKGKTVALEELSISHFVLATALDRHGLKQDDVKRVNLPAANAASAFLDGKVDAVAVWNPWVNQIMSSGQGRAVFTSRNMPGLIVDALVARQAALETPQQRRDLLGMVKAWYDVHRFIGERPEEASAIMSKAVGLEAEEYALYLPGTHFFSQKDNLDAFGPASEPKSLLAVSPTIVRFLKDNGLLEGEADLARGIDASLVLEAAGK